MNELAHSISLLFEPDSAPVVAVSGGNVIFFNSAAQQLFPTLECGQKASSALPSAFLTCDETLFVCTAQINRKSVSASGIWYNGMLLLRMNIAPDKYVFAPEALTSAMKLELFNMQMALDLLSSKGVANEDKDMRACLSVLYHAYYKLLRSCENTSLAVRLSDKSVAYRPIALDLVAWLKKMLELVKESSASLGISISLECPNDLLPIAADPELLEHLMLNLLSNSLRYCTPGSCVTVRLSKKGSKIQLSVDDNGAGFSSELLGYLFRRQIDLGSAQSAHTDQMGLYIVWGIAELHGGSVTVTNRRKGGASVRITLPSGRKDTLHLNAPNSEYDSEKAARKRVLAAFANILPDSLYMPDTQR